MVTQQRSFHIITCPAGESSSHASLVVSGRGVPHQTLTAFYEDLQKTSSPSTIQATLSPLLSFFSFLEEPEQESCCSTLQSNQLSGSTYWAGSPAEIRAAIRAYLLIRWGCLTRAHGRQEEILLSPLVSETAEMRRFLAASLQFYQFALERHDYWYESNPAAAFHLPLHSRLWHALRGAWRASAPHYSASREEGGTDVPVQSNTPAYPDEEAALPALDAEARLQFVPVWEPVASIR